MLSIPANDSGITRYRQNRFVAFMISSVEFRELIAGASSSLMGLMLTGLVAAVQDAGEKREITQRNCSMKKRVYAPQGGANVALNKNNGRTSS
jgi:hypothetical protein